MANPRKFSEKIALHNQKQAEETAAFERIMQEVSVTRVTGPQQPTQRHLDPHAQAFLRPFGSLPNVNQMSGPPMQMRPGPHEDMKHYFRQQQRFDPIRAYGYANRRMPAEFQNRPQRRLDSGPGGPYSGLYLSPPDNTSWRRTNSDSALHQSVMNPNAQDPFQNPAGNMPPPAPRRDMLEMSMTQKMILDAEKLHQQMIANRPKSCEDSQMNVLPNDCQDMGRAGTNSSALNSVGHRQRMPPNPTNAPGLSHVTQIGNNTGSLPDLTSLQIPSPLPNPIDYDDHQKQIPQNHQQNNSSLQSPASMLYNQARSTGNLPSASAINNPHLGSIMGGGPASPSRSRRHTHNGPSPLSLSSPDQNRRMKFHGGVQSPKLATIKGDLKSPPIGGPYPYHYPMPSQGMHSQQHCTVNQQTGIDARLSGPQMHPQHRQMSQHIHPTHQGSNSGHPVLRVDVNAASKVGQYSNHPHQMGPQRHSSSGHNMTSPITSPTSPTSRGSLSPGASPQHLPELTSTSNPALSEAYYRSDLSSMQPLQHQFEQFHVVGDSVSTVSSTHAPMHPPVYSSLQMLVGEAGFPQNMTYGAPQRTSDSSIYTYNNGSNNIHYKNLISPTSKIPDIVFTGVDDQHTSKLLGGSSGDVVGYGNSDMISSGGGISDFGNDYFPGEDLKVNLGLEELQMLEEPNIEDPSMEDDLNLNNL